VKNSEKKIARILLLFFGIFLGAITIVNLFLSLSLRFEIQPIYDLSVNYFSFKRISPGFVILPGFLSVLCFQRLNKLNNE
jgi:uncharacterized SAM-binding protein YcdF (DUF218 family)